MTFREQETFDKHYVKLLRIVTHSVLCIVLLTQGSPRVVNLGDVSGFLIFGPLEI